jgi:peptide-methionine (S)-S-oxide reductase
VIFYHTEDQKKLAMLSVKKAQESRRKPIATEVSPAKRFWRAEDYHQRYLDRRSGRGCGLYQCRR